jgi:hypothetical protein
MRSDTVTRERVETETINPSLHDRGGDVDVASSVTFVTLSVSVVGTVFNTHSTLNTQHSTLNTHVVLSTTATKQRNSTTSTTSSL